MCGFVGYINNKKKNKKEIKKMNDKIKHRGPDDEDYYIDEDIALGFRRLSIIDLAGGRQPMTNEDDTLVIVFNGEVYNYQELKSDLVKKGHIFKNNSDTEVILHGYEEYKEKIVGKLRGMFAFVIWDIKNKELFGARDYFGIKPFYYSKMNGTFMFASEIKSLLENKDFSKVLNEEALKLYLNFQSSVLDETFFKDVFRLRPGHYLKYKDGKLKITKYFNYEFSKTDLSFDEMKDKIHEEVDSSVKYHKISDVKVGAFLSGGIDSSYIVSLLMPNETFSVGFDYDNFNETMYAKELSDMLKIKNYKKLISSKEYFDTIKPLQYYADEPYANLSAIPLFHLSKMAAKNVKVVLSGEGADELFGGYINYSDDRSMLKYRKLPFFLRRFMKNFATILPDFKGKNFLIRGGSKTEEIFVGQSFVFDDKEANSILKDAYKSKVSYKDITKKYFDEVKDFDDVIKKQYVDLHLWLPNDILLKADRTTMANSLELRVPFLDKEVFRTALTIPSEYKIANGTTKYILREASSSILPSEWVNRKKKAFPVPIATWFREDKYYEMVKKEFNSSYAKEFFNTDKIIRILEEHKSEKKNNCRKIYTIYAFLLWYKTFFIEGDKNV